MQLSPTTRSVLGRAASSKVCCNAWPPMPATPNPALTTIAARLPRSPSAPIRSGRVEAAAQSTAKLGSAASKERGVLGIEQIQLVFEGQQSLR